MADRPDRPDRLDDDLSPGALDGLGLDALTDGVRPSASQWAAIDTAASTRQHRRPWVISAAAALVLVVGVAAVLVGRSGRETADVATGSAGGGAHWVIPPEDADVTMVQAASDMAMLQFVVDGRLYVLQQRLDVVGVTGSTLVADFLRENLADVRGVAVELPNVGQGYLMCSGVTTRGSSDGGTTNVGTGPSAVGWSFPGWAYHLTSLPYSTAPGGCGEDDPNPSTILDVASGLRLVDDAEWQQFLDEHPDSGEVGSATATSVPPSSTTSTQVPPNVDPAARGQIIEAFERMDERDTEGGLPYVDGEDADLMARVADAGRRTEVTAPTVFTVDDIDFLTPTSASVAFTTVASLPTGPVTTRHVGSAVVVDGRWQVTRGTLEDLVTQAGA